MELTLPTAEALDDLDFDDFYDHVEDVIRQANAALPQIEPAAPSLDPDDLLHNAQQLIPLKEKYAQLQQAFAILEEELDSGTLQMAAQPLADMCDLLFHNLLKSNEMVYLLYDIKQTRKKAKRIARILKRLRDPERIHKLELEADQLEGGADFSGRIEGFAARGLNVDGLWAAHKQMEERLEKMRDAFDSAREEL